MRPGRVSPPQNTQNQSLLGAMTRTLHSADVANGGWLSLPASAIIRSEVYVIIGLGALVVAAAGELIGYWRSRSATGASPDPQPSPGGVTRLKAPG